MEYAFEIESSAGCRMIVSLLVVTTNVAALDVDAPDEDDTAAHDDLPSSSFKLTSDRHYRTVLLQSVNAVLDCADLRDLALVLLQIRTCSGPSTISDTYVAKK